MVVLNEVALNNIEVLSNLKNDEIKFNGLTIKSIDDKDEDYKQVDNLSEIEYIIYFTFHQLIVYIQKNNDKQKINKSELIESMDTAIYNIYLYFKLNEEDNSNIIKILNQIEELLYIIENDNKYSLFSKFNIYMIYFINPIIDLVSDLKQKYTLYYNFYNYVCYKDNLDALNELLNDITSEEEEEESEEEQNDEDISDLEEEGEGEEDEENEEDEEVENQDEEDENQDENQDEEVDDTLEIIEKEEEDNMEDTDVSDKTWTPGIFRYAFYVPPTSIK
jgi:hypothetical protein